MAYTHTIFCQVHNPRAEREKEIRAQERKRERGPNWTNAQALCVKLTPSEKVANASSIVGSMGQGVPGLPAGIVVA
jgi:hypothetical protein